MIRFEVNDIFVLDDNARPMKSVQELLRPGGIRGGAGLYGNVKKFGCRNGVLRLRQASDVLLQVTSGRNLRSAEGDVSAELKNANDDEIVLRRAVELEFVEGMKSFFKMSTSE